MSPVTAPPRSAPPARRPTPPKGLGLPRDAVSGMPIQRGGLHPVTVWFLSALGAVIATALVVMAIVAAFPRA